MKEGYWSNHTYHRRAVIDLDGKSFCGWNRIQRMIDACGSKDRYNPYDYGYCSDRDKTLIAATFLLGCRIGETVRLQKSMIRIADGWVYCEKIPLLKRWRYVGKPVAGGRTKRLPATRDFVFPASEQFTPYLEYWLSQADDYLFPSRFRNQRRFLSINRAWQIIEDAAKRARFNCWPHRIRSERASQLAKEYGWKEMELMRFFGWKTQKEAMRYVHESVEDMKQRFPTAVPKPSS